MRYVVLVASLVACVERGPDIPPRPEPEPVSSELPSGGFWQSDHCPGSGSEEWPLVSAAAVVQVRECFDDGTCRPYNGDVRWVPREWGAYAVEVRGCASVTGDLGVGIDRIEVAWLEAP